KGCAAVVHRPTESILRTPVRHQFVHCKLCSRDDPTELNRCRWLPSPIPQRASGILKPVRCFRAACPRQLFFFWVAGSIIDRMICIKESRGILSVTVLNNFNRSTTRLFYKARPPFGRLPKDCGWWHSRWSRGRHTRPDFKPKVQRFGEPTGTAIDGHERQWRGRCCRKQRAARGADVSVQVAPAWLGSSKNFRVNVKVKNQYCRAPSGHRGNIKTLI